MAEEADDISGMQDLFGTGLCQEVIERVAFRLFGKAGKTLEWLRKIRSEDPYAYGRVLGINWAICASLEQLTTLYEWNKDRRGPTNEPNNRFASQVYLLLHPEHKSSPEAELQIRLKDFWRNDVRAFDDDISEDGRLEYFCLMGFVNGVDDAFADFHKAAKPMD